MNKESIVDQQILDAISGSGGIISTIAKRLRCEWRVAEAYIQNDPEIKAVFEAERETMVDLCESVVFRNVQIAQEVQRNGDLGDTTDAKWLLSRLGKARGYSERQEITGKDGEYIGMSPAMLIAAMRTGIYVVDEKEETVSEERNLLSIS